MDLSIEATRNADAFDDKRIAHAIDRVLDAERIAQSAVAECEKEGLAALEQARQQRRALLERAQQRIVALHIRAARALEHRVAQLREQHGRAVAGKTVQDIDRTRLQAAIDKLADGLIVVGDEES
jgi:F0F1-type ATP synthase membrane subunit b/b'